MEIQSTSEMAPYFTMTKQGYIQKIFPRGGKLGPHKRMTLAIMIIAYMYIY